MNISRSTQHYVKYKGRWFPLIKFKQTNFETTNTTPPEEAIQCWIQGRDPRSPGMPPSYFWTTVRSKRPKKNFCKPPPPPYLKVWIRH